MASGGTSKKRRSTVWEHFNEIAPAKVRCVHCSVDLSYSGSTSTMLNHMRSKHSDNKVQQATAGEVNPDHSPELTRKQQIDNSLVDMMVGLRWRISAVNCVGFKRMTNCLDPTYVIPSREELKALRDARHEKPKRKHPTWESSSDSD